MDFNLLKRNLKTLGLSLLLAGGVLIGSTATAKAQIATPPAGGAPGAGDKRPVPPPPETVSRPDARRVDAGGDVYRSALEQGMRDGQLQGTDDSSRRKMFRPDKSDAYRDGDKGYLKGSVAKNDYKDTYRQGFIRGYERGYMGMDDRAERNAPPPHGSERPDDKIAPPPAPDKREGKQPPRRTRRQNPPVPDGRTAIPPPPTPEPQN